MTDYKQKAASYARKYKLPTAPFQRQIGTESNYNPKARSPAGATGIAQIMPATAKSWGIDPNNPDQSLDAAAKHMAQYVKQFGSLDAALRAYNAGPGAVEKSKGYAETNAYVKKILGNSSPSIDVSNASTSGGMTGTTQDAPSSPSVFDVIRRYNDATKPENPTVLDDQMATTQQMLMDAIDKQSGGSTAPSVASMGAEPTPQVGGGKVTVASGANRAGAELSDELTSYLGALSGSAGPITVGTGTNHNRMTVDGNVSDHWDGHGADLPQPIDSKQGDLVAAHALANAGVPFQKALSMAQKGGLFNVTPDKGPWKGHRIQVIWKTNQGGNHHNHVHVGIR